MNIDGIIGKIESNADKIGMAVGILADPVADGRGINGGIAFMVDRLSHWKLPTIESYTWAFLQNTNYQKGLKTAILGYLLGEGAEIIGQAKIGKALKDGTIGMVKGLVIGVTAFVPATQSSAPNPNVHTGSGSGSSGSADLSSASVSWGYKS